MHITNYEKQYIDALREIYEEGYSDGTNERTGKQTKRLPGVVIRVDVKEEFPILKSKQVFAKTALREILWIWQQQSNNIHDLKAKIWDKWADKNGSIMKAYGYQMNQPVCIYTDPVHKTPESFRSYKSQPEYIIEYLREFPNGRWGVATLWNPSELAGMNLVPCCHTSTWNLGGGRLNCVLDQRSGDMPYGVPFNTTQYAELMILIARDLGVEPGILTHVITDAHIYDTQMDGVKEQLCYYDLMEAVDNEHGEMLINKKAEEALKHYNASNDDKLNVDEIIQEANDVLSTTPYFYVDDSEPRSFFEVDGSKCCMKDYKNMGKVDFGEIAV